MNPVHFINLLDTQSLENASFSKGANFNKKFNKKVTSNFSYIDLPNKFKVEMKCNFATKVVSFLDAKFVFIFSKRVFERK